MGESYLTLKQLIGVVDIPENSLKRYMIEHQPFLNYKKVHNRYQIHVDSIEPLKLIRKLYGEGYKKEAVDEALKGSGIPVTLTVESEEGTNLVSMNEEVKELKQMMKMLYEKTEADKQEMKEAFQQEIQDLKTIINQQEAEKVKTLRLSMKETLDESKQAVQEATATAERLAVQLEAEKSRGFFSKLFGVGKKKPEEDAGSASGKKL